MFARSVRASARCSGCSGPRSPARARSAASANQRGVGERGDVGQVRLPSRRGQVADAVEQPVARRAPRGTSATASDRSTSRPTTSRPADAGTPSAAKHVPRPRPAAPRRRSTPAPTARAGRRGTAGRSSRRGRPAGCAGGPAGGWRVAQQGEPVVEPAGDLRTGSARVRAAASSMASGSPSSERQTASTVAPDRPRRRTGTRAARGPRRRTGRPRRRGRAASRSSRPPRRPPAAAAGWWRARRTPGRREQSLGDGRRRHPPSARSCRAPAAARCRAAGRCTAAAVGAVQRPAPRRCRATRASASAAASSRPARHRRRAGAAGNLHREPGLAHPGRPGEGDQPVRSPARSPALQLGVATQQRAGMPRAGYRVTGSAPADVSTRWCGVLASAGILVQDLLFQALQLAARGRCPARRRAAGGRGGRRPVRRPGGPPR